ncbi:hypothetical protein B0O80DRAFT_497098 [Mortierella sp. GBAus27b]|nr:hypothetical protein BGX31_010934 [Mortierella sp. GBA43]KAI8356394.1 hypothetical protein B0O80DRAFT_497098 [Mortierella sp. GBAus27b]
MVSKIFGLALLAAAASHVRAYYWHAEVVYEHLNIEGLKYVIYPVDSQIPENQQYFTAKGGIALDYHGDTMIINFNRGGYANVSMVLNRADDELVALKNMVGLFPVEKSQFPCTKMDEVTEYDDFYRRDFVRKFYTCSHPDLYGVKGVVFNPPGQPTTTPTTTIPTTTIITTIPTTTSASSVNPTSSASSSSSFSGGIFPPVEPTTTDFTSWYPTTTTAPPKPTSSCLAGYKGKKNGKGPNNACCSHSDDCKETCIQGVCGIFA